MKLGTFHKSILVSCIIVFLVVSIVAGVVLWATIKKNVKNVSWPPITPDCPDWWISNKVGHNRVCINKKGLGTCNQKMMNFNKPEFTGSAGTCAKYTWAKNCNLSWDGITYGISNPCS
jgi:hypothetical protein